MLQHRGIRELRNYLEKCQPRIQVTFLGILSKIYLKRNIHSLGGSTGLSLWLCSLLPGGQPCPCLLFGRQVSSICYFCPIFRSFSNSAKLIPMCSQNDVMFPIVDCPTQLICTWIFICCSMTKLKEHSREIRYVPQVFDDPKAIPNWSMNSDHPKVYSDTFVLMVLFPFPDPEACYDNRIGLIP